MNTVGKYDVNREMEVSFGDQVLLSGRLRIPTNAVGTVIFAYDSDRHWHHQHIRQIATALNQCRIATLLLDLVVPDSENQRADMKQPETMVQTMARQIWEAAAWVENFSATRHIPCGILGIESGAEGALQAAMKHPDAFSAIVCIEPIILDAGSVARVPTLYITDEKQWQTMLGWAQSPDHQIEVFAKNDTSEILLDDYVIFTEFIELTCDWFMKYFPPLLVY